MAIYKHYKMICENPDCNEDIISIGLWSDEDGVGKCHMCHQETNKFYSPPDKRSTLDVPMINQREQWKKKIPGEFKEWMEGPFSKRHGEGTNINMRD